jgi:hypothetical protein
MLVVLSISPRRLCGLAKLTEVQLSTAAESVQIPWNHHLVCSHCSITDCQTWPAADTAGHNVAVVQRALLLAAGLTLISAESAFPSKPSHVSTWSGQCQPRLSHELQHCTRSRALTQIALAASPLKTFPPSCGTRKDSLLCSYHPRALLPNQSHLNPVYVLTYYFS